MKHFGAWLLRTGLFVGGIAGGVALGLYVSARLSSPQQ
jgi:hypothetical protein